MSILISVVTAVYNDEKYIKQSIESILGQTFTDFEYIIVDDGSTDGTVEILKKFADADKRIVLLNQKNQGAAAARNLAINAAKGVYIALQDSDDISTPDRLIKQLRQLTNSDNNAISCTDYKIIDMMDNIIATNSKTYKNIGRRILTGKFCICHPTIMLSKKSLIMVGGYNTFYNKTEDFDLVLRLLEGEAHIEKINECLYNYRIRENSEGSMNNGAYAKRVYENHLNRIQKMPENFTQVYNDYGKEKNHILKRQAREIFFSENYSNYIRFYLKVFYKLPIHNYLLYFFYAIVPLPVKQAIKLLLVSKKHK